MTHNDIGADSLFLTRLERFLQMEKWTKIMECFLTENGENFVEREKFCGALF